MKVETTGKPMFDEDGNFVVEDLKPIFDGIKKLTLEAMKVPDLELENQGLKQLVEQLESKAISEEEFIKQMEKADKIGSIVGARGVPKTQPDVVTDYSDKTKGFTCITMQDEQFHVIIHHKNPETGRDTTAGGNTETLVEAVVLRNRKAATLLRERLIDFERYLRIVRN